MKVSRKWLQTYFEEALPSVSDIADALTFHAFEIEETAGDMLDVKVLPDRACYALAHRGIAMELSAILNIPMKRDPLRETLPEFTATDKLIVTGDPEYVVRHTGALVKGLKVGPSPSWLREALEAVGQRSINNVVDAMNFVMLDIGQPSGGFDLAKLKEEDGVVKIDIRRAKKEKITVLTGETYELPENSFVFSDADGQLLDIAGIKGGLSSGVTESTTDLFISAGNYDGTLIRKTAQALKLFTDASSRFQNRPSPELTAYGMRAILDLVTDVAGGEVAGVVDLYPNPAESRTVSVSTAFINHRLGSAFSDKDIEGALARLGLPYTNENGTLTVTPTFERRDVVIAEDVVEEVGRILGYDQIPETPLPPASDVRQERYRGIEMVKDFLTERGFTEISTPSFAVKGEILLANPLQEDKPYLRPNLAGNMEEALAKAVTLAPRVLGPVKDVRLFEVGNVFEKDGERLSLALGYRPVEGKKQPLLADVAGELANLLGLGTPSGDEVVELPLGEADLEKFGESYEPKKAPLSRFRVFSAYPFALRDIAVWTPSGTEASEVVNVLLEEAGELLARVDLFDRFEKDGKVSYAFRLVFESFDKTLSDTELSPLMEKVTSALNARENWNVR